MSVADGLRRTPIIDFRRQFWFAAPPEMVWHQLGRFDDFESWWSWLREFRADRAGIVAGNVLRGAVVPPVPLAFHLEVSLEECHPPEMVRASIRGDVRGAAAIGFAPVAGGTLASCDWTLRMASLPLRTAARTAFPLVCWGHDRVVEATVETFTARLGQ